MAPKVSVWRPKFLDELRRTGNVSAAAEVAGIDRSTAYKSREKSQEFAAEWDEALEEACDALELEARRRAVDGVDHPVIYEGEITDSYKRYSDTLLIFLLKAHRPEKFRERVDITSLGERLPAINVYLPDNGRNSTDG